MKAFPFLLLILLTVFACKESDHSNHPCYDESLVHDNPCTADCPGVIGCDDKSYCNECEAARVGIRPK